MNLSDTLYDNVSVPDYVGEVRPVTARSRPPNHPRAPYGVSAKRHWPESLPPSMMSSVPVM